jgi:recombination protein RecR
MTKSLPPFDRLVEQFRRLPGVGIKSAKRMTFAVLDMPSEDAQAFADAIIAAKAHISRCKICGDICEGDVCSVCLDSHRDQSILCVVEDSRDVAALEKMREYHGLYHVLGGLISPTDGIGPDRLLVRELLRRLDGKVKEVILATNPSVEGEATALYIAKLIKPMDVLTTRLAYGIPVGGELQYADDMTLFRAIEGRRKI